MPRTGLTCAETPVSVLPAVQRPATSGGPQGKRYPEEVSVGSVILASSPRISRGTPLEPTYPAVTVRAGVAGGGFVSSSSPPAKNLHAIDGCLLVLANIMTGAA